MRATTDTLAAALTLHASGCSVVAVRADGSKRPQGSWQAAQTERATEEQLHALFAEGHPGIGIICGAISGNLEMLELEGRAVDEGILNQLAEIFLGSGLGELWQRVATGWLERSPSGGLHFHYRIDGTPVPGNTKLASRLAREDEYTDDERDLKARHPHKKILRGLIETRGEGGFVVTAPSYGTVHASGRPYELLSGGPESMPGLTADEHQAVHAICRMIDAVPSDDVAKVEPANNAAGQPPLDEAAAFLFSGGGGGFPEGGLTPGDDFEQRATWSDILTPHGWKLMFVSGQTTYWQRPGKTGREPSATTGRAMDRDRLYVFTTSTEFEAERPYTKFGAYTLLNHAGDHSAAARTLRRQGYGTPAPEPVRHLTAVPNPTSHPVDGTAALNVHQHPAAEQDTPGTYTRTDDGNALRLIDEHEEEIRYVPQRGKWLRWNGYCWGWDDAGEVREMCRAIARALPNGEGEAKHRARSLSSAGIASMITMAQTDPRTVALMQTLDAHPLHLNTPAGVVDLATGKISPPDPAAMHTRTTSVAPDQNMPTPRWAQFIADTFGEDSDVAAFVQRLAGYSASGDTRFHILPFLNGPGGNGKSVILDVLRIILGDYAATAPNTFLMAGQQQHETEVARLHGLRLVVVSEVNQDARFDEAKMKLLTGGDALTARFMRQDHFTFEPTHHLWLMGNHLPAVKAGGDSFWRRLRLIPFTRSVPPERKIEGLARILADEEGPGILAWMIAGAVDVFTAGLREPAAVMAFTETYAEEEDSLARFMSDCCYLGGGANVTINTAKLRAAYDDWCRAEGETPLKPQVFGRELRTRFSIEQLRSNGRRFYVGVALLTQPGEGDDDE
ncbi:phage/plasmid primase, P4 family [Streptomyces sp. NPDC102279]|uniref:phage/plasmid primase, P4 family n=1 Tax=Streptomyces sp. NPDC102279 TaxID=3366153 RepID=UPI0037FB49A7